MSNQENELGEQEKAKKSEAVEVSLNAVTDGEIIPIEEVGDAVFSQKLIGDGYAIKPTSDVVYAPVSGKLIEVADAKHAFYIETDEGLKVLIHIGIDTLFLNGEGFQTALFKNMRVEKGDQLAVFDRHLVIERGFKTVIPVIILDNDLVVSLESFPNNEAKANETVALKVRLKK